MGQLARTVNGRATRLVAAVSLTVGLMGSCVRRPQEPAARAPASEGNAAPAAPTQQEAAAFLAQVNAELKTVLADAERMMWVKSTYITEDTNILSAQAYERLLEYVTRKIKEARRFDGVTLPDEQRRQLYLLRYSAGLPAPADPAKRSELSRIATEMESAYAQAKYCSPKLKGKGGDRSSECLGVDELNEILGKSRDQALLADVWNGWHATAAPLRTPYRRFVELGNEGARELGFQDMGAIWRGGYDMSAEDFRGEIDRLYVQLEPLYEALHCYTRARLRKQYGEGAIANRAPIPAHLMGNLWAQEWTELYPMLEPHAGVMPLDLTPRLVAKKHDPISMFKLGEQFFVSLGMAPLPKTFWERSMFVKPRDREVECHASAWTVDMESDLRIKMCVRVNQQDFITIHHELGHNYYSYYYRDQLPLFREGANSGFHEGIGDTISLSITPAYLARIGLLDRVVDDERADLNQLMKQALSAVAFLPFGRVVDEWRWRVFDGSIPPTEYNAAWWRLRREYQGVEPPSPRTEEHFDPAAKFHVAGNVPYMPYFVAHVLQYQFHRALCKVAGHTGPLHRCSIYGNRAAGERLKQMLALGASKPWPQALQLLSGETRLDASAIVDYYAPLMTWLAAENRTQACGWQ